jgi:hypothetical protein
VSSGRNVRPGNAARHAAMAFASAPLVRLRPLL